MRDKLLSLVKAIVTGTAVDLGEAPNWQEIYRLAMQQGVLAIVFDALMTLPSEAQPPKSLKLQWIASIANIEHRYNHQRSVAMELTEQFHKNNIKTIVLKGLAIGTYYSKPEHRECGDLDCYLMTNNGECGYELGNEVCEQLGAKVEREYYKHSNISYRGLMVENHAFCTAIRGGHDCKEFERHLQKLLSEYPSRYIDNTKMLAPCAYFNALFLTAHGLSHFLSEGIKLRHILDWALLLKAEQENINWSEFYYWTDKMNMTRFANVMTAIAVQYLGLEITNPAIQTSSPYIERVLEDTFKSEGLHNKGYSTWVVRFLLIVNKLSFSWKFHKIYQKSIIVELARSIIAFLIERNPKL